MRNEKEFISYLAQFDQSINQQYNHLIDSLSRVGMSINDIPDNEFFSFDNYPAQAKTVAKELANYHDTFQKGVINAMKQAIVMSFAAAPRSVYGVNVWEEAALNKLRDDVSKAWLSARLTPEDGLSLSQRVWNYTNQTKAEFEMAVSDIMTSGIQSGTSAEELARRVKGRLNNPDAMYRRYHLKKVMADGTVKDVVEWRKRTIDADGKVHFMSTDIEHPGRGVYRSARQNALRMTATEINTAYRYADCMRWQNEPYVIGIRVMLSDNHPIVDMCDDLAGDYPKWFLLEGWHPRCYDEKSEVLTDRGWLLFKDVQPTDKIFSLIPETKGVEWVGISRMMAWQHEGIMYHFHNRSLDCLVTPEHEMVYLSKDGKKRILRKNAKDYTKNNGGFYRSSEYDNPNRDNININGLTIVFDAFCEFMGYYLSDGSACRASQISIAQYESHNKMVIANSIIKMGLTPHITDSKVYVYDARLCEYLKGFGHSIEKYVPEEIKEASKRQIQIFLKAFNSCDGTIRKKRSFVGNRGGVCEGREVREFYTSSKRMASDIGELLIKIGSHPSYRIDKKEGTEHTFKNGVYSLNADSFRITECYSDSCTVFDKDEVRYDGMVYDLELERNHIMYIRRNGKCFWGSNCRCTIIPIMVGEEEFDEIMKLPPEERKNYISPNLITEMPDNYINYVEMNRDRIERAIERGTQPWWVKHNYVDGDINSGMIGSRGASVTPGDASIPSSTSMPFGAPNQDPTLRTDGVTLTPDQLAKVMEADRLLYTPEQLANMDRLEKIFGVPRGTSMSFEVANRGSENPHFSKGGQFTINCQTATVTHELRRRGFNVTAKGFKDGYSKLTVNGQPFGWEWRYLNPDGTKVVNEYTNAWAKRKGYPNVTKARLQEYLGEKMAEDGRYEIYCSWQHSTKAHVFMAERKNGVIRYFDPQSGEESAAIAHYFDKMAKNNVYCMRVDDKIINPHMAQAFNPHKGFADTSGFVIEKPKTAVELAKERRMATRNEQAIKDARIARSFMTDQDRKEFRLLNIVAEREGIAKVGYGDLYSVTRDTDGKAIGITMKESALPQQMRDSLKLYRDTLSKLDAVDLSGLGLRRTKFMVAYIEDLKDKTFTAVGKGTMTYKQLPVRARAKVRDLVAEREEIKKAYEAKVAAEKAATPKPEPKPAVKPHYEAESYAELKQILGDEMPPILEEYEAAVARNQFTDRDFLDDRDEMEKKLKKLFREKVVGYGHFTALDNVCLDDRILDSGIWNTQIEVEKGVTSRTDGYHQSRCGSAEFFYKPVSQMRRKSSWDWKPGDYYRCAAPLEGDPTNWYVAQNTGYGGGVGTNAMVLFRKDKVVTTFTFRNSLGTEQIPSLTLDPKVVSFDQMDFGDYKKKEYDSVKLMVGGASKSGRYRTYMEAQVYPFRSRNGVLGANEIEAIILPDHPSNIKRASKGVWDKWYEEHVTIYYYDHATDSVKLFREGKSFETPEERAKRIAARNAKRIADRNAALAARGLTPEEYQKILLDDRTQRLAAAKTNAQNLLNVAQDIENADLSLDNIRKMMAKGNYFGAQKASEEARVTHKALKAREAALKDIIPDAEKWHKQFTIDEMEQAHTSISKQIRYYESKYSGDLEKQLQKFIQERDYSKDPTQFSWGTGKKPHKTWELAYNAYQAKVEVLTFEIKKKAAMTALMDVESFHTSNKMFANYISDARKLITAGDLDAAMAEIAKATKFRQHYDDIVKSLSDLKAFNTTGKAYLQSISSIESMVSAGDFDGALAEIKKAQSMKRNMEYHRDRNKRLKGGTDPEPAPTLEKILKLGESSDVIFSSEEFTQAKKDAAKWFRAQDPKSHAQIDQAFRDADKYMSKYAVEMWKNLSKEEKMVLWLYTDGSRYINDEILQQAGKVSYVNRMRSVIDNSLRNGLVDANILTSIIEKAPALEEGLWMQSGKSKEAIRSIFGIDLDRAASVKKAVGTEGASEVFMSCHTARDGAFTKRTNTGSAGNDVVLTIYAPKGTKGAYMEPFASFGDESSAQKRGKNGFNWSGTYTGEEPSNQVEFLLQRGSKFRITKIERGANGKWYIDVDLIEQRAQTALDTYIPGLEYRSERKYRPYEGSGARQYD